MIVQRRLPHAKLKTVVIIPTYNERANLSKLLPAILRDLPCDVLVVDDNSPDGTAELVEDIASRFIKRVFLIRREAKLGLGTAYLAGFRWALDHGYDLICEMDADFSHHPAQVPELINAAVDADLVLGSRYVQGGGTANWSPFRQAISKGGSIYARLVLALPYRDLTGGFKCFRRSVLETLDLDTVHSTGYAFQIELTFRAHRAGYRIVEVPIQFEERRAGQSKMSARIILEALVRVWQLRLAGRNAVTRPSPAQPDPWHSFPR